MCSDIKLTVLIPTYNRKDKLIKTLKNLENQTNQNFLVVISDNNSDYNIYDILEELNPSFSEKINIYERPMNIGADANIYGLFDLCKTKFAWLLSDDDYVLNDAVDTIYKYFSLYPETGVINFSIVDFHNNREDIRINSLDEFINIHTSRKYKIFKQYPYHGDLIFLSNKVYNLEVIKDSLSLMFDYMCTRIATAILIVKSILDGHEYIVSQQKIVDYVDNGVAWKMQKVALGTRIIPDFFDDLSKKQQKKLFPIFAFNIPLVGKIFYSQKSDYKATSFFDQIYHGYYKYFFNLFKRFNFRIIIFMSKNKLGNFLLSKYFCVFYPKIIQNKFIPLLLRIKHLFVS